MPIRRWRNWTLSGWAFLLVITGGCGTVYSRVDPAYHYPGKSVVEDVRLLLDLDEGRGYGRRYYEETGEDQLAGVLVSIPIDLVLDTVLLPLDLAVGVYLLFSSA